MPGNIPTAYGLQATASSGAAAQGTAERRAAKSQIKKHKSQKNHKSEITKHISGRNQNAGCFEMPNHKAAILAATKEEAAL